MFSHEVVADSGVPVTVAVDGGPPVPFTGMVDLGLTHGPHTLSFVATRGLRSTRVDRELTIDAEAPRPEIDARSLRTSQGHTLPLFVRTDEPTTALTARFLDRDIPLHPITPSGSDAVSYHRAWIGIPIRQEAGAHPLTLTATDELGNSRTVAHDLHVDAVDWPITGRLPLSKKKASVPSAAIVKMRSERDPVYAEHLNTTTLREPMRIPTHGRDTSDFGSFREYPDGRRSHHDAKDIANEPGTPIVASAPGTVRIARLQAVHGNAVLLAHGQGIVTLYSHMRSLNVEEGQEVQAGEVLGEMGSTGRSTGPHLHWGVVVDSVTVDPTQWLEPGLLEPAGTWTPVSEPVPPQPPSPSSPE